MGLDWSTFLLEIGNFLILIWILKRFLYRPVKQAIEARRQRVAAALSEAEAAHAEAEQARADYEARRKDLERGRSEARAELGRTLTAERERRLAELREELARERDKANMLAERERGEADRRCQEGALKLAGSFAAKLLAALASPAVQERLFDMLLEQLPALSEGQQLALSASVDKGGTKVLVQSAYPLDEARKAALARALAQVAGHDLDCVFSEDPALIAGVQIDVGALLIGANLRDELRLFTEAAQ
jgi:F-type H+-transporting ATPase subunit b